jgi:hypothetical protein
VGKQLIAMVGAALIATLVVAGCGSAGSSTASISKTEFIEKADAACKKGEEEIQKDFATFGKEHESIKKPSEADYAELIDDVLVGNAEQEVKEIRALGIPEGDEKPIEAMLEAREKSLEKAQDNPKAVVRGGEDIFAEASKLAKEYGLRECGNR